MKVLTAYAWMGLGIAIAWWVCRDYRSGESGVPATAEAEARFTSIPMPDGVPNQGIIIFAPQNCPSDAAQRTDALAQYLSGKGIAFTRSTSAEYGDLASREVEQVMAVMNGPIPVVYVNGKAKANPKPEEVEAWDRLEGRG